jgi:predicted nucleic acid-binding protein
MSSQPPKWTVDANIILRYILRDDEELAAKARGIWQAVAEARIVAVWDPVTLAEVVFVLSSVYGLPNDEISAALIPLLQTEGVVIANPGRYLHALRLFGSTVKHFGDACACAAALEQCDGRMYSFDRKLSSLTGITRAEEDDG